MAITINYANHPFLLDEDKNFEDFFLFIEKKENLGEKKLQAVVTVEYSMYFDDMDLLETTTLTTHGLLLTSPLRVWYRKHVTYPTIRFLHRFVNAVVTNITYRWI